MPSFVVTWLCGDLEVEDYFETFASARTHHLALKAEGHHPELRSLDDPDCPPYDELLAGEQFWNNYGHCQPTSEEA